MDILVKVRDLETLRIKTIIGFGVNELKMMLSVFHIVSHILLNRTNRTESNFKNERNTKSSIM